MRFIGFYSPNSLSHLLIQFEIFLDIVVQTMVHIALQNVANVIDGWRNKFICVKIRSFDYTPEIARVTFFSRFFLWHMKFGD